MSEIPDTIHPSTAQYELTDNPNNWQLIARTTKGIVTPANAIDTVAIAGAKYGIDHLDSTKGRLITALSFTTDFFDGRIARATGTQSPLGEAVDAGGDKLKLAYGAVKLWRAGLVDKPLLTAVVAQNTANAGLTLADRKLNQKPAIHPTKIGKLSFFAQELGIELKISVVEVTLVNIRPLDLLYAL